MEEVTKAIYTSGSVKQIREVKFEIFDLDSIVLVDIFMKLLTESYTEYGSEEIEQLINN
jgi:hypothetical protein